jgi:hypothetical protein
VDCVPFPDTAVPGYHIPPFGLGCSASCFAVSVRARQDALAVASPVYFKRL